MDITELLPWLPVVLSVVIWIWGGSWAASKFDSKIKSFSDDMVKVKKELHLEQEELRQDLVRRQEEFECKMELMMLPECQKAFAELRKSLEKMDKDVAALGGKLDGILSVIRSESKD
ncbi:MAG: hypothetical protein WC359_12340 [Dehalococcoidia bacterium]|jgi:hypothetical protein